MANWLHEEGMVQGTRTRQEDDFGVFELPPELEAGELLLVLADGMGGAQGGARASALAVSTFIESYDAVVAATIPERLERTLLQVNARMALETASAPEELDGMGCTLLAVVLTVEGLYWISVGDSPLWLWRRGRLLRLNQDHAYRTVLAQRVSTGELSADVAARHPARNALISAVTGEDLELVDLSRRAFALHRNDGILLASDGLLTLSEKEITRVLRSAWNNGSACQALLAAISDCDHPHQDNVTVLWARAAVDPTLSVWRRWWQALRRI